MASLGECAQRVGEHLAVGRRGESRLVQHQPFMRMIGTRSLAVSGQGFEEVADTEHADPLASTLRSRCGLVRSEPEESLRQGVVVRLQALADLLVILVGQPQAEARAEIVVAGEQIVKTVAFRAMSDQSGGDATLILRVAFRD